MSLDRSLIRAGARSPRATGAPSVTRTVAQFALTGFAVVALLGLLGVELLGHIGQAEAIREATAITRIAGTGVIAPRLTPALLRGAPRAIATLDAVVRASVLRGDTARVKVWDASGRIVYSDEHRLIGTRYALGDEELAALESGGVKADVTDLNKPENRYDRGQQKLLEVYVGVRSPQGQPLLFESYDRFSAVVASGGERWRAFAPALLIGIIALELVQIPFAWSLARRLRQRYGEREALLQAAVEASGVERQRIARDLHDGVVQTLAGVSFGLAAAERDAPPALAPRLALAAGQIREGIGELRTLLVALYPSQLESHGLEVALTDLLGPLANRGIDAELQVDIPARLEPRTEALLFRASQEGLRNVVAHAAATRVELRVGRQNGSATLKLLDNGQGFDAAAERGEHFGLRMIGDLAREAGGALEVESVPGAGTTLRIEVPA